MPKPISHSKRQIHIPDDIFVKRRIDNVASLVSKYGSIVERVLLSSESKFQEDLSFIWVTDSLEHDYYKWKVLSLFYNEENADPYLLGDIKERDEEATMSVPVTYYPPEPYEMPE